jgi:hypothetical protein
MRKGEAVDGGDLTAFRFKILPTLAEVFIFVTHDFKFVGAF